jgi:hypothetical protein
MYKTIQVYTDILTIKPIILTLFSIDILKYIISISIRNINEIIYYLRFINKNNNNYIFELEELDIPLKLKYIEKIIISHNKDDELIKYIMVICHKINDNFDNINSIINYHNTKLFNRWRKIDLEQHIILLKHNVNILKDRLFLLLLI